MYMYSYTEYFRKCSANEWYMMEDDHILTHAHKKEWRNDMTYVYCLHSAVWLRTATAAIGELPSVNEWMSDDCHCSWTERSSLGCRHSRRSAHQRSGSAHHRPSQHGTHRPHWSHWWTTHAWKKCMQLVASHWYYEQTWHLRLISFITSNASLRMYSATLAESQERLMIRCNSCKCMKQNAF